MLSAAAGVAGENARFGSLADQVGPRIEPLRVTGPHDEFSGFDGWPEDREAGAELAFSAPSIDGERYPMPYVHCLRRLVRGRYVSSRFYVQRKRPAGAIAPAVPYYHQLDYHS